MEDLIKNKFGDGVQFFSMPGFGAKKSPDEIEAEAAEAQPRKFDLNFDLKPKEIKAHLDKYVIKQDEAKKALAIAVCDHYNHVMDRLENAEAQELDYAKQNVLLLGPTGVGKTYLVRLLADLLGVPFVKADATRFSETGYVGANVDDLVKDLVRQADEDVEAAQYGIVYLDEADKIAAPPQQVGRDVTGRGVQFGLLKLMEETEVDLRSGHDIASQMQSFMDMQRKGKVDKQVINTRHILFIVSGAFSHLKEIIQTRLGRQEIGITSEYFEKTDGEIGDNIFSFAQTEDFIKFGFEPEFVGRLPIRVHCEPLDVDDLFRILKQSRGSILRQYKRAFKAYGIDFVAEDGALMEIAKLAHKEKTGARALMTVCEKILRDFKFELPSLGLSKFILTADVVKDPKGELERIMSDKDYLARLKKYDEIRQFGLSFKKDKDLKIDFSEDAVGELLKREQELGVSPAAFLEQQKENLGSALKLIEQSTHRKEFLLEKDFVLDPTRYLENLVKESVH